MIYPTGSDFIEIGYLGQGDTISIVNPMVLQKKLQLSNNKYRHFLLQTSAQLN